jgi:hypothetical protein
MDPGHRCVRWEREIGRPLSYGEFGETLTTERMEVNDALGSSSRAMWASETRSGSWTAQRER